MRIHTPHLWSCAFMALLAAASVQADPQDLLTSALSEIAVAETLADEARENALLRALDHLETIRADFPDSQTARLLEGDGIPVFGGEPITISRLRQDLGLPDESLFEMLLATLEEVPEERREPATRQAYWMLVEAGRPDEAARLLRFLPEEAVAQLADLPTAAIKAGRFDEAIAIAEGDRDPFNRVWSFFEISVALALDGQEPRARSLLDNGNVEMKREPIASYEADDLNWLKQKMAMAELALGDHNTALARVDPEWTASNYPNWFHEAALLLAERGEFQMAKEVFAQHNVLANETSYFRIGSVEMARIIAHSESSEAARAFMASVDYSRERPLIAEADRAQVQFLLAAYAARDDDENEAIADLQTSFSRQPHWFPNYVLMMDFCEVAPRSFEEIALSALARRAEADQRPHVRLLHAQALIACGRREEAQDLVEDIEDAERRARGLGRLLATQ